MMKRISRFLIIVSVGLFLISSSCDKEKNYPKDSILGAWLCQEDGGVYGYRQYNVSIDYQGVDSTMIVIYNFYNLGFNVETYATVQDTLITLFYTNTTDGFTGTGHIERDYSAIYWNFSYFGQVDDPNVVSVFLRP
jgi:hypothetical protein